MSRTLKKIFITVSILSISHFHLLQGQDFHFSNITENLFKHNPAAITRTEKIAFQLTYRNQWPGISSYNTYDGSFVFNSEPLKSTAGIFVLRDIQGDAIINLTRFGIIYAYKTYVARNWFLAAGLDASYNIYSTNFSNLIFENDQYPTIIPDENLNYFDFSAGFELSYQNISRYGISVSRLASFQSTLNNMPGLQVNLSYQGKYLINTSYNKITTKIEPSFYTALQKNSSELLYGSRVDIGGFVGGIYVRQNLKFQFDAVIILLGTRFDNFSIYYCYDINLSGADSRFTKLAAHEVTFLYDMQYKRKRHKKRTIKCPKI